MSLTNGATLKLTAVRNAKSGLPAALATSLNALAPFAGERSQDRTTHLITLFDPDGDGETRFHKELQSTVQKASPDWALQPITVQKRSGAAWWARRNPGERVFVRALAWSADGGVLDGLRDEHNLERVLCRVLARAYPNDVTLVADWLTEITRRRNNKPPRWKAAIHLWSALVDEKATEHTAAARFFGQHDLCAPHVVDVLKETGIYGELARLMR